MTSDIEPRLVAVRGPLKGSILVLPDGDYTIGLHASHHLYLEVHAVSRYHCILLRSGGDGTINDLKRHNGTFVNGTAVTRQPPAPRPALPLSPPAFMY